METVRLKAWQIPIFCLFATAANVLCSFLVSRVFHLSLFLDTFFTVALTFTAGIMPGVITALVTTIVTDVIFSTPEYFFYSLCSITEVLIVGAFLRRAENSTLPGDMVNITADLLLLSIILCFAISFLGGLIDFIIGALFSNISNIGTYFSPEYTFKVGLLRNRIPVLLADIFCRIPVNIVDRFIVVFGGYALARLIRRLQFKQVVP
jgi:uncharacterized membrane protein